MTQPLEPTSPGQTIAARLQAVRKARGWSAREVAERCARAGMPELDRSTIANIELGRRRRIGVDEWLVLAYVLGVAPVHLLVPLEEGFYAFTPDVVSSSGPVRQWVRGNYPMVPFTNGALEMQADRDSYRAQVPGDEWVPPPEPTTEEQEARRRQMWQGFRAAQEAGLVQITYDEERNLATVTPIPEGSDDGSR
ncbi:MAG: helix-turn-helix domain-containing protein [Mycobacteriales bacterium]